MKKILLAIVCLFSATYTFSQTPYTNTEDPKHAGGRILNGIISKYIFLNDAATFSWYATNQNGYTPEAAIVSKLEGAKGRVKYIVFGGSWCSDTQFILPKFFKLQEAAGVPDSDITLLGVNRKKELLASNLPAAMNITNVPTIIVMKDGKEVGRVIEYGKTGKWDKELADLL